MDAWAFQAGEPLGLPGRALLSIGLSGRQDRPAAVQPGALPAVRRSWGAAEPLLAGSAECRAAHASACSWREWQCWEEPQACEGLPDVALAERVRLA